jgi:ribosomal protein S18 acetylase RimI-like enzyme
MIKIRKATLRDCKDCFELSKIPELANPSGEPSHIWWMEAFVKEKQLFFVAEENKKVLGFTMGEIATGKIAFRHMTVVKKEYQNKGIGKRLAKKFEDECRKRKVKAIMLYGYAKNKKTIQFQISQGFEKGSLTYEFIKFL